MFFIRYLLLFILLISSVSHAKNIQEIRLSSTSSEKIRLVLDLDSKADINVFRLNNPSRLVIDFEKTKFLNKVISKKISPINFIKSVRLGSPTPTKSRVVIELPNFEFNERHFLLPPQGNKIWRFVLDLTTKTSNSQIDNYRKVKNKKIIVIDPGHGGQDPGAISKSGKYEKDLVLMMGKETKELFEKAGYKVVLTRDRDIFIPLRGRIQKAHEAKGDLFISIHADSSKNTSAKGLSIYTISETASDKEAAALAERENKADILSGMDLKDYQPEVSNILIDFAKKFAMDQSAVYADYVIDEMKKTIQLVPNAHRFAGFVVLKSPNIPSVLLEMGYLSNKQEEKQMWSKSYRNKISKSLLDAVNTYFKNSAIDN